MQHEAAIKVAMPDKANAIDYKLSLVRAVVSLHADAVPFTEIKITRNMKTMKLWRNIFLMCAAILSLSSYDKEDGDRDLMVWKAEAPKVRTTDGIYDVYPRLHAEALIGRISADILLSAWERVGTSLSGCLSAERVASVACH